MASGLSCVLLQLSEITEALAIDLGYDIQYCIGSSNGHLPPLFAICKTTQEIY
jgi:hypothetical protein